MVYCAKSKTAKKRTWCKKTPCAVDSDNKSCVLDGKSNRCRARISKKALPKKKSSKIQKKTKKAEEVVEVLPTPPLRRSARLNTAKGVATPPKPMSKKASRAKVFNNKDLVTTGGLSTKDLVKSNGRIVSKVKSKIGKKNGWALAVKKARKELKIEGFAIIKKGEPIYDLAKKYYKGSVGGDHQMGGAEPTTEAADNASQADDGIVTCVVAVEPGTFMTVKPSDETRAAAKKIVTTAKTPEPVAAAAEPVKPDEEPAKTPESATEQNLNSVLNGDEGGPTSPL